MNNLNQIIISDKKLKEIIDHYKEVKKRYPDEWGEFCRNQNLRKVIEQAARAKYPSGKHFEHQYRIKKIALADFLKCLSKKETKIKAATTFEELLEIVKACGDKINGIGELACYDAAARIGVKLSIYPTKIYMHAGPKIGAKKLLGVKRIGKFIDKSMLPAPFKGLECSEIEAILCIYKNEFDNDNEFDHRKYERRNNFKSGKKINYKLKTKNNEKAH